MEFRFSCTRCSSCCRGESGLVMLSLNDIERMCNFFNYTTSDFIKVYCRPIFKENNTYVSLIEKKNGPNDYDCIFWENGCKIYSVRPLQCSSYPFWHTIILSEGGWEKEHAWCPGIGKGQLHSHKTVNNWLNARQSEPYVLWKDIISSKMEMKDDQTA